MVYYAGLDVSLKEISICVVDAGGKTVAGAYPPLTPRAWRAGFGQNRYRRS